MSNRGTTNNQASQPQLLQAQRRALRWDELVSYCDTQSYIRSRDRERFAVADERARVLLSVD